MKLLPRIIIYTDGACLGNPGPGGYGTIIIQGSKSHELSRGYRLTTNNRMELLAAIAGLEALPQPSQVTLFSDSQYMVNNYNEGHVVRWQANGWKRDRKTPAKNKDLWQRLLELMKTHQVTLKWVAGHAGQRENERCDRLAVAAASGQELDIDDGFEVEPPPAANQMSLF